MTNPDGLPMEPCPGAVDGRDAEPHEWTPGPWGRAHRAWCPGPDLPGLAQKVLATASKATAGPWKLWGMQVMADPVGDSNHATALLVANTTDPHRGLRTFNASFICLARTAAPQLAEAVLDLTGQVVRLTAERDVLRTTLVSADRTTVRLAAERDVLAERQRQVLALHAPEPRWPDEPDEPDRVCSHCIGSDEEPAAYPCQTAALFLPEAPS